MNVQNKYRGNKILFCFVLFADDAIASLLFVALLRYRHRDHYRAHLEQKFDKLLTRTL